jgi:hypothetical protein
MKRLILGISIVLGLYACKKTSGDELLCGSECTVSSTCNVGESCTNGCCAPFQGCTPGSCGAGQFCDADLLCKTVAQKCQAETCECHIVSMTGQLVSEDSPVIRLPAMGRSQLQVVLATGTAALPGASFNFSLQGDSPGSFSVQDGVLTATDVAGEAVLRADAEGFASCTARVINQGAGPLGGQVRFAVFDAATGKPVEGAKVVVDIHTGTAGDGLDDGNAALTDAQGVTVTSLDASVAASSAYTLTVFKGGYNYLSLVGMKVGDANDVAVPLLSRGAVPDSGGFTGKLDMSVYERLFNDGEKKSLRAGLVASSFPIASLFNFNTELFLGPMTKANCGETPNAPGCYKIELAGMKPINAAIPGGVVLGLAESEVKDVFEVVGQPGRRYAWSLGTEFGIEDITDLLALATPYFSECTCDTAEKVCNAEADGARCACDLDCGFDMGGALNQVHPLLPRIAVGVRGNLPLKSTPISVWKDHVSKPYAQRGPDEHFPKLDSGDGLTGPLALREAMRYFTDFEVPALPADPLKPGSSMEGMLALTGVNATGFGFVPMGLGAGVDCTSGNCLDRASNPAGFDGRVNGSATCLVEPCTPGVPARVQDGHLPMFRAMPYGGLEGQEQLTVLASLPISALVAGDKKIRASGVIVRGNVPNGSSAVMKNKVFPGFVTQEDSIFNRSYSLSSADPGLDAHWVTLQSTEEPVDETPVVRWNVYMVKGAQKFHAPAVPAGMADPMNAAKVNTTHISFKLKEGESLVQLAKNAGRTLNDLSRVTEGVSVINTDMDVRTSPQN